MDKSMKRLAKARANMNDIMKKAVIKKVEIEFDERTGLITKFVAPVYPNPVAIILLLQKCIEIVLGKFEYREKEKSKIIQPKSKIEVVGG